MSLSTLRPPQTHGDDDHDILTPCFQHQTFFDHAFTHYMTFRQPLRFWYGHPLRRIIKGNPAYATKLSSYPITELFKFHQSLQLRLMNYFPERLYFETHPRLLQPLIRAEKMPGLVKTAFQGRDRFLSVMTAYIDLVKDGATDVQLIMVRPFPRDMLEDQDWKACIAPHCRIFYLEVQQTLFLRISTETRYAESFPTCQLRYDDSGDGVEGHALSRITYGLKKHLAAMNILEYEILSLQTRRSQGIPSYPEEQEHLASSHSCERMFISLCTTNLDGDLDENGNPWPSLVIETGPAFDNTASRSLLHYAVDWWFTQSRGLTRIVLLLFFNYLETETVVEKWVRSKQPPFRKRLAQTIIISVHDCLPHETLASTCEIEVSGERLVLGIEALLGRPKGAGEEDVVFDKGFLAGLANGFLLVWPNIGPKRYEALHPKPMPGERQVESIRMAVERQ
ncbi:hypothetical protein BGW36DRAFT_355314 [Talaromyces proteolyticus]|uniref:Uncharacterized protein n=1 Tax=Talaromyces proteolyticus TaxID=1131652 RepID=A0AAD4L1I4_9EURO|nr:uncharacterized protein BGW36DRAFT_355314 [Talaromyces proteolyticus]KAH8703921.1 hypothetical protein BGW36DRAFT_355314 [Talaromyces proteolyticus]